MATSKNNNLGQFANRTSEQTGHNLRRVTENIPLVERASDSFNKLQPFKTTVQTRNNTDSVYMNLYFTEHVISCASNPPILGVSCTYHFEGFDSGVIIDDDRYPAQVSSVLPSLYPEIPPGTPDFSLSGSGIVVPLDGCYSVLMQSSDWGTSYYEHKSVTSTIFHNGHTPWSQTFTTTGVLSLLGPLIWFYVAPSPAYTLVTCKAGDTINMAIDEDNLAQVYPWLNGGLSGFFADGADRTMIKVTLVALLDMEQVTL